MGTLLRLCEKTLCECDKAPVHEVVYRKSLLSGCVGGCMRGCVGGVYERVCGKGV